MRTFPILCIFSLYLFSSTTPFFPVLLVFHFNLFVSLLLSCSSSDARWGITRSGSVSSITREMERLLSWRRRKRGSSPNSHPEISSEAARATRRRSSACRKWREVSSEINIYRIYRVFYVLLFSHDLGTFHFKVVHLLVRANRRKLNNNLLG